ncbi:hypothetical protein MTR67_018111 [Solanum verrucosum]|uniref:Gag-pol polyprotein n=1 Tax=Solanum verrucosum TaxID=315347 RepID=A0AAF0TM32_SOLVR|nr:hypothetical protein MTR67_018111 [Solanum verrucosum]
MNTRANPRRMEEEIVNEGVPPQGLQGDQVRLGNQGNQVLVDPQAMTNEEVRSALLMMAQAVTTQAQTNRDVEANVNPNVITMASRLRDFVRMNPPVFLGSMETPPKARTFPTDHQTLIHKPATYPLEPE